MLRLAHIDRLSLSQLLSRYDMDLVMVPDGAPIPGSYWGECEAGLQANKLLVRLDTPVHSVLHEASHYVCMTPERRTALDTDAGGDDPEESAVCYLQVLLADELPGVGRDRLCADMDEWGYSFRLGSTRAWLEHDAVDARQWLQDHGIIDERQRVTWRVRS